MSFRPISIASVLALATVTMGQGGKISFSEPAATLDHLLKDLGDKAGVSMRAAPSVSSDVMLISVHDVTLSDLLAKIAEVENGSWIKDGDAIRLEKSAPQRDADAKTERANLASRYKEALAKITKEAAALPAATATYGHGLHDKLKDMQTRMESGGGYQNYQQVMSQTPAGRLLTRLIPSFSADDLAQIPENGRAVFSDNPNRMQYRLPGSSAAAINSFVQEQNLVAEAAQGAPENNNNYFYGYQISTSPLKDRPAKLILAVTRRPLQGQLECNLEILDAKDNVLGQAQHSIGVSPFEGLMPGMPVKQQGDEKPIEFSAESKILRARLGSMMGDGSTKSADLPDALRKKVIDPKTYEPLGFGTSEALIQYGANQKANVVAFLSDMSAVLSFPFAGDSLMPSLVPQMLKGADEYITVKDGWMTVMSYTPATARLFRSNRESLGRLLQAVSTKGMLTIDDAAAYALTRPGVNIDVFSMFWGAVLDPQAVSMLEQNNLDVLRFYGSLTPVQRQLADNNRNIPFSTLVPAQRDALVDLVFGADSRLNNTRTMVAEPAESTTPTYPTNEPTQMLPNGIPPAGGFTMRLTNSTVVMPVRDGGRGSSMDSGLSAQDLAWRVYAQEHQEVGGTWASLPQNKIDLSALKLAERLSIDFQFTLSQKCSFDQLLRQIQPKGKTVAFADLPEDFRKEFDKMTSQYKDMKFGPGIGQGTPPPPNR